MDDQAQSKDTAAVEMQEPAGVEDVARFPRRRPRAGTAGAAMAGVASLVAAFVVLRRRGRR